MVSQSLRGDAIRALAGADYVREQLVSALAMGPNSLQRRAYAIKCRVKSEDRLIEKVLARRERSKRYSAKNATDIVGLRLLCLFSDEIELLLKEVINFIGFCQSPSLALFRGSRVSDALTEAIVYASNAHSSGYTNCFNFLKTLDLPATTTGEQRVRFIASSDEQPYSSVHLVVQANSFYANSVKPIPVEIQIRTAFEDVWAEIDHPRRYKGARFDELYHEDDLEKRVAKSVRNRLGSLKGLLDQCSRVSDDIKTDYDEISKQRPSGAWVTSSRVSNRSPCFEAAPRSIKREIQKQHRELTELYDEIAPEGAWNSSLEPSKFLAPITTHLESLEAIKQNYETSHEVLFKRDMKFLYFYNMERGILFYWRSRIGHRMAPSTGSTSIVDLDTALEIFYDVLAAGIYPNDSLLEYRIGLCVQQAGQTDLAISRFKKALVLVEDDALLPVGNVYRSIMPRQLGYAIWLRFQKLSTESTIANSHKVLRTQAADLVGEAMRITSYWYRQLLGSEIFAKFPAEKARYENNILSYFNDAFSIYELKLEDLFNRLGVNQEIVDIALKNLSKRKDKTPAQVHTLLVTSNILGRTQLKKLMTNRLRRILKDPSLTRQYEQFQIALMVRSLGVLTKNTAGEKHAQVGSALAN